MLDCLVHSEECSAAKENQIIHSTLKKLYIRFRLLYFLMLNLYRIIENILHLRVSVVSELRDFRHADITQIKRNDDGIGGF